MRDYVLDLANKHLPGPFRIKGAYLVCKCPLHKGGNETHPSFGINLEEGFFNCFTCHKAGDIGHLLKLMGMAPNQIQNELKAIEPQLKQIKEYRELENRNFFANKNVFETEFKLPEAILGIFDWDISSYLPKFDKYLLKDMEVGLDKSKKRLTFPIRDMYGNLAGISGGWTEKEQVPKYKVYQGGYRRGSLWVNGDFGDWFDKDFPGYRCENHNFLWNWDRVFPRITSMSGAPDTVYIVEGFKACMWMIQCGFENTVATMGSNLSDVQQKLIHRFGGTVVLCFDNDNAGRRATEKVGAVLWEPLHTRVKKLVYPLHHDNTQPDDYVEDDLREMIEKNVVDVVPSPLRRQNSTLRS